jgi:hypothetical protein
MESVKKKSRKYQSNRIVVSFSSLSRSRPRPSPCLPWASLPIHAHSPYRDFRARGLFPGPGVPPTRSCCPALSPPPRCPAPSPSARPLHPQVVVAPRRFSVVVRPRALPRPPLSPSCRPTLVAFPYVHGDMELSDQQHVRRRRTRTASNPSMAEFE